jgi:hypothetical protein
MSSSKMLRTILLTKICPIIEPRYDTVIGPWQKQCITQQKALNVPAIGAGNDLIDTCASDTEQRNKDDYGKMSFNCNTPPFLYGKEL